MQTKVKAGYYSNNVNHEALSFLKSVLNERKDGPIHENDKEKLTEKI